MSLASYIHRIEQLDQLIRLKSTGSPKQLAAKLGISERAWYQLREELVHEFGFPISYCRRNRTYYYAIKEFRFYGLGLTKSHSN